MIAPGKFITFDVEGQTRTWLAGDEGDLRDGVQRALTARGFRVQSLSIRSHETIYIGIADWSYSAIVVCASPAAHASHRDIASIVANAFYQAGGSLPTVTARGYDPAQPSGVQPPSDANQPGPLDKLSTSMIALAVVALAVVAVMFKR